MSSLQEPLLSFTILLARILLASVFLVSGVHKALWFSNAVEEFKQARIPMASVFAMATVILHLLASAGLLSGFMLVESALALAAFTALVTIRVHDFWNRSGKERLDSSRAALANLAIVGGLLLLAVTGPGSWTL